MLPGATRGENAIDPCSRMIRVRSPWACTCKWGSAVSDSRRRHACAAALPVSLSKLTVLKLPLVPFACALQVCQSSQVLLFDSEMVCKVCVVVV